MRPICRKHSRYWADVICHAARWYSCFTLSYRDAEEMLGQRGAEVSYEAIRCWPPRFGPLIAANLRRRRSPPTGRWHLDEVFVRIGGRKMWLWRAVEDEGEVLDVLVQNRQTMVAALKLPCRLLRDHGIHPETITTDKLASHSAAVCERGRKGVHRPGGLQANNRTENSQFPIRRSMPRTFRAAAHGAWAAATKAV